MYWNGFGATSETYHTQQQQKRLHIGFVPPPDKKLNNSRYHQHLSQKRLKKLVEGAQNNLKFYTLLSHPNRT